jgi:hypothetical protein
MIGLLWLDMRPVPFEQKVAAAAERYREKYNAEPTTCYVNPRDFPPSPEGSGFVVDSITIKPLETVLRYHLWLVEEDE